MNNKNLPSNRIFTGRVGLQQRVLPFYRAQFFDHLAEVCTGGLSIFAGKAHPSESVVSVTKLDRALFVEGKNRQLFSWTSPWYLLWQQGLLSWLKRYQPEVLIVEANPRYLSTRLAIDWMHSHGRPVIAWGLGISSSEKNISGFAGIEKVIETQRKKFILSCDKVIAYSHLGASEYTHIGIPQKNIFIATNAITPRPIYQLPKRADKFIEKPRVLFVGRLQQRKRVDNLLFACASLPIKYQPSLHIVGDGPALKELKRLSKSVYPQAEFLGLKRNEELRQLFLGADLFVLPGSGGLAIQEAMAYGLPVIVAEGDGTQNDLVRPENGWLIPPNDLSALQQALLSALSDVHKLRQMGAESYRIVRDEINIETMVQVFVDALNSFI